MSTVLKSCATCDLPKSQYAAQRNGLLGMQSASWFAMSLRVANDDAGELSWHAQAETGIPARSTAFMQRFTQQHKTHFHSELYLPCNWHCNWHLPRGTCQLKGDDVSVQRCYHSTVMTMLPVPHGNFPNDTRFLEYYQAHVKFVRYLHPFFVTQFVRLRRLIFWPSSLRLNSMITLRETWLKTSPIAP